jgi:imidazolonepropionase
MNRLAVINCGQLVTMAGPPEADGALLVEGGRIAVAGPRSAVEPLLDSATEVVDAGGRAVLPGFVDAHTHPVYAGARLDEYEMRARGATYEEIAAAGGGIRSTVRLTRLASEDDLYTAARRRMNWFLACGTTTIEAKSGYGLSLDDELKLLRVIRRLGETGPLRVVPTFLGAHEIPDEYRGRPAEYGDLVADEMIPEVARLRLAEYCDVFCEPSVFPVPVARRILAAARGHGLRARLHADQLTESGGAQLAAEMGAATADHLEHTGPAGIAALKQAGVQPVLLPGSVYALGRARYPQARAMIDAGLRVVLATDFNPGSSPTPSIPMILSLASTHLGMSPAEALAAVTVNAAHSLGRGAEIGSLEPGKAADFVIHDAEDYREIAYHFGLPHAQRVYIGGHLTYSCN